MEKQYIVTPADAVKNKDKMYFVSEDFNGLFYSDLGEEKAHFIGNIPGEYINQKRLYGSLQLVRDRYLCMIPFTAKEIAVYDIENNKFDKVPLPDEIRHKSIKFMPSAVIGGDIYIFETYGTSIYKFDVCDRALYTVNSWEDKISEEKIFDDSDAYFRYQTAISANNIYVPFCNANAVLVFNYADNVCSIEILGKEQNGYSGIWRENDKLYFSPRNVGNKGAEWNLQEKRVNYLNVIDKTMIGITVEGETVTFCSGEEYAFVRSGEFLVYDHNKTKILFKNNCEWREWSTKIDLEELKKIKGELLNGFAEEECWFNFEIFIEMIGGKL